MSIKRKLPTPQMVKYRGIFDFPKLLKLIHTWGTAQRFEMHEKRYKHKVPDARGAEQEVTLLGWRKIDAYLKFWISVDVKGEYLKDVDVIKDGKKKKLTQGKVRVMFNGYLELDYQNRFESSKFLVGLRDFYHKFVVRQKIQNVWEDTLYYRLYKLNKEVRVHLDMEGKSLASEGRW